MKTAGLTDRRKVHLTELVLEALKNNGDKATTTVIYRYVEGNKNRLWGSSGSRHSVQGAVSSLKSAGLIAAIAPATYQRVKDPLPRPVEASERRALANPSPLDPMYD